MKNQINKINTETLDVLNTITDETFHEICSAIQSPNLDVLKHAAGVTAPTYVVIGWGSPSYTVVQIALDDYALFEITDGVRDDAEKFVMRGSLMKIANKINEMNGVLNG